MLPTHEVPCPRCGKTLYSATSLEDAVVAATPESPKIEHDERGDAAAWRPWSSSLG